MAASASSSPSSALESIARAGGERGVPLVGVGRRAGNCESGSWRAGVQGASKASILPRHAATPLTVGPHWRRPRRPLWIATQRPPGPPGPPAHPPPLSVSGRRRQPTCRLGCPGWPCVWRRRGGTFKEGGNTNAACLKPSGRALHGKALDWSDPQLQALPTLYLWLQRAPGGSSGDPG